MQEVRIQKNTGRHKPDWIFLNECNHFPGCTFGVIEMDGFEILESNFLVKLIKHGLHSSFHSQVVSYNNKDDRQNASSYIRYPLKKSSLNIKHKLCFLRRKWCSTGHKSLWLHSPAAKAWQVSRHTPTLVWSLTLSMMLFSSGNWPPTVLPWPLIFSNTEPAGRAKEKRVEIICLNKSYIPHPATAPDTLWLLWPKPNLRAPCNCFLPASTAVYSCESKRLWLVPWITSDAQQQCQLEPAAVLHSCMLMSW